MRGLWSFFFAAALLAQQATPPGTVRGTLLEWDGSAASGSLSLRIGDHHVYCFLFDDRTSFERDDQRISIWQLKKGDILEVVSDRGPRLLERHARTVRLLADPPSIPVPVYRRRSRAYSSPIEDLFPRGNLTFAGVVSRLNQDRFTLRTRSDPEKKILLRSDTRYLQDGSQVPWSALKVNTRIFVHAGENFEGELEAYQVVWGHILRPRN